MSKKHYSLNANQIHVLKLIYKFRYVTASLLAQYKGISRINSNKALQILLDQKYIGQIYKPDYRIDRKGPRYHLTLDSIRLLRKQPGIDENALKSMYKDGHLSEKFVNSNLAILSTFLHFRKVYPGTFHAFTKSELGAYAYFPETKPDLYLNRKKPATSAANEYLVDIYDYSQTFVIKNRIDDYIEHYDLGDWESDTGNEYPSILIVCPDGSAEKSVQLHTAKKLDNTGIDELKIYTTTMKAIIDTENNKAIWSEVTNPQALVEI